MHFEHSKSRSLSNKPVPVLFSDDAANEVPHDSEASNRILVCLDESADAPAILESALSIAVSSGSQLVLLRAVGVPAHIDQSEVVHADVSLYEQLIGAARADLARLAQRVPRPILAGTDVQVGIPWETICNEALRLDCDLVVLGSHKHSLFGRLWGTTASKVVNHCDRAVLITPALP
jgi:nucleotide-binding universal stress UspA family protein